jgi:uncharacterized protein involved in exopolysaccharide biosynthesis
MAVRRQITDGESADLFDVRGSLRSISEAVRHHKLLVLLTCALTLALVTVYVCLWPPIYRAEATLMAERNTDAARDSFYVDWSIFRKDDAQTEMELIKAGPVLRQVIDREKLTYDDVYHPFLSHLTYLWQKSFLYQAYHSFKNSIFPEKRDKDAPTPADIEAGRTLVDMAQGISLDPVGETNIGKLTVKAPSPKAARIANTLMDVYLETRAQRHHSEAMNSYQVLDREAARAQAELGAIAARRRAFAEANGITFDFQKETIEVGKLTELEQDIATGRRKIATLEATIRELDAQVAAQPPTRTNLTVFELNAQREAAKQRRLELEIALVQNRQRFREDSPEIADIRTEMAKLDDLIAHSDDKIEKSRTEAVNEVRQDMVSRRAAMQAELEGERAGLAVMEQTAAAMRVRLDRLPEMMTTMRGIDQEYALAQQKYNALAIKGAEAAVSATTTGAVMPSVRVVEYATPPSSKYWPRLKILYPAGMLVGLLLGVVMAVALTYASGRVYKEYVERPGGSVPLYGHIRVGLADRPIALAPGARQAAIPQSRSSPN